jgi:hypothetical protein
MLREAASSSGRHTREKLDDILVRGWSDSKAVANPGGCIKQLLDFLERKASPSNAQPSEYIRIEKVCVNPHPAGQTLLSNFALIGPLSFHAKLSERRPRFSNILAVYG